MPCGKHFLNRSKMRLSYKLLAVPLLVQGATSDDISLATQQRLSVIVGATTGATSISAWLVNEANVVFIKY